MESRTSKFVYSAALLYTFITGFSFLCGKIALAFANPFDLLAYRFSASFLVVIILLAFKLVKVNYNLKGILKILPLALFYPLMFFAFQTFGLEASSSSEAGILSATIPVFTLILATLFLKEETTVLQKLSIFVSVLGVVYISLMKGYSFEISNLKGITLLLISALSFAGYSVLARKLTKNFSSFELSIVMMIISFIFFNFLAITSHLINGTLNTFFLPLGEPSFLISVLYLGVLSTLLTSVLSNFVLSKIEASKMSVFTNLATVISIIAGVLFLQEEIFYYHIIGSIMIILGVIGANYFSKGKKAAAKK